MCVGTQYGHLGLHVSQVYPLHVLLHVLHVLLHVIGQVLHVIGQVLQHVYIHVENSHESWQVL
jgi:hypothetical protein